jgi:hypothetical protein
MSAPKFQPGDRVDFTNDNGALFPGKRVVKIDTAEGREPRYFIEPTDTPWFSVAERNLDRASEPAEARPIEEGAVMSVEEFFGPPISIYTRAQGIEDGVLVDISEEAVRHGIRFPTAITRAAWDECVEWSDEDNKRKGTMQSPIGRLIDVCSMAAFRMRAAKALRDDGPRATFAVMRTPREGRGHKPHRVQLVVHVGPGDSAEPVLTIMLPGED